MNSIDKKVLIVDTLAKRAPRSTCSDAECCRANSLSSLQLLHNSHSALTSHGLAMSPWLSVSPTVSINLDTITSSDQLITNRTRSLIYPPPVSFSYQESAPLPLPASLSLPLSLPFTPPSGSVAQASAGSLAVAVSARRRSRGEKKPTPEDQKDERYLERRRRNNTAAKKSRDARRAREDQIALRACILEHENAVLRAQLIAVKNESEALRTLCLSRRNESSDNNLS